nr:MAG TPA: hypothetical protein [Caudoviricetes sp.]
MCIKYNLYTCGDNEQYGRMLSHCEYYRINDLGATLCGLHFIAEDIWEHSSTVLSVGQIVELLIDECCATIKEEDNE